MTVQELFDRFLTGELDEAGWAALEAELRAHPELAAELGDQQRIEQALKILLGDDSADQKVTVSVLSVLHADPIDDFKVDLLARVKEEDVRRKDLEAAARTPVPAAPEPQPARPPIELLPPKSAPRPRRRPLLWGAAALAASALVAAGAAFLLGRPESPEPDAQAFLLSTAGTVRVQREGGTLAGKADLVLEGGDLVTVDEPGEARIGFSDDPTRLEVKGPAAFRFVRGGQGKRVELVRGRLEASIPPQGHPFRAATPHSEVEVADGQFRLFSAPDFARIEVLRGDASFVRVRDRKTVRVPSDHYAVAGRDLDLVAKVLEKQGPSPNGPAVVAYLRKAQGEVFVFVQSPADRTPARPGQPILDNQSILTEGARSGAILDFPDHTRVEVAGDTIVRRLVDEKDRARKSVVLERGTILADVTKQPADKSMLLVTAQAEVAVLGTRFTLAAEGEATRLQVEEGAVKFTRAEDRKSIVVRSGYFAVAAPGRPLDPERLPGGIRYLELDLAGGVTDGDGEWAVEGRSILQKRVSRGAEGGVSTHLFRTEPVGESVILEATVEVNQVTPDTALDRGTWGFGLEAMFQNRSVVLRSAQGPEGASVFEFPALTAQPFEHGREGTYRLKLSIERREGARDAVLRGKIWQGDIEPDSWVIENVYEVDGPLTQAGLQTSRCSCSFSSFKIRVLQARKESR